MFKQEKNSDGSTEIWFNIFDGQGNLATCIAKIMPESRRGIHEVAMSFSNTDENDNTISWEKTAYIEKTPLGLIHLAMFVIEECWINVAMEHDCILEDDSTWERYSYKALLELSSIY